MVFLPEDVVYLDNNNYNNSNNYSNKDSNSGNNNKAVNIDKNRDSDDESDSALLTLAASIDSLRAVVQQSRRERDAVMTEARDIDRLLGPDNSSTSSNENKSGSNTGDNKNSTGENSSSTVKMRSSAPSSSSSLLQRRNVPSLAPINTLVSTSEQAMPDMPDVLPVKLTGQREVLLSAPSVVAINTESLERFAEIMESSFLSLETRLVSEDRSKRDLEARLEDALKELRSVIGGRQDSVRKGSTPQINDDDDDDDDDEFTLREKLATLQTQLQRREAELNQAQLLIDNLSVNNSTIAVDGIEVNQSTIIGGSAPYTFPSPLVPRTANPEAEYVFDPPSPGSHPLSARSQPNVPLVSPTRCSTNSLLA